MALLENFLLHVGHSCIPVAKWAFCVWIFIAAFVENTSGQIGQTLVVVLLPFPSSPAGLLLQPPDDEGGPLVTIGGGGGIGGAG